MLLNNNIMKILFLSIICNLFFLFQLVESSKYYRSINSEKIIVEVDITPTKIKYSSGPYTFIKSINQVLLYNTSYCSFIPRGEIIV